jgi:hypothetical protein
MECSKKLSEENKNIKVLVSKELWQSRCPHVGFQAAKGEIVVTMDADLQDNPEEIPEW